MHKAVVIFAMATFVTTQTIDDEDMFLYWRRSNGRPCEPFTTFKVDCNSCVCNADGVLYCTKMACLSSKTQFLSTDLKKTDRKPIIRP